MCDRGVETLQASNGGLWGEHPGFTREDWRDEVAAGDVQSGYWEWVLSNLEQIDNEEEEEGVETDE